MTTATTTAPPQFLTMGEVCKLIRRSRQTVYLWVQQGYFPEGIPFNPSGTRKLWPLEQVLAWLRSQPVACSRAAKEKQQKQLAAAERLSAGLPPRPVLLPKSMRLSQKSRLTIADSD
jgi:predicted DNA-binding transcriptional regulator AlpA